MDVNVIGVMWVIQVFGGLLGMDIECQGKLGWIIMLFLLVGQFGVFFMVFYVVLKYVVEGLFKFLWIEFQYYGIDVVMIGLGLV